MESAGDDDVVIRPEHHDERGMTSWVLNHGSGPVLSETDILPPGEQTIPVEAGEAAEFLTMVPHAFAADGPAEILGIFGQDGRRSRLR